MRSSSSSKVLIEYVDAMGRLISPLSMHMDIPSPTPLAAYYTHILAL